MIGTKISHSGEKKIFIHGHMKTHVNANDDDAIAQCEALKTMKLGIVSLLRGRKSGTEATRLADRAKFPGVADSPLCMHVRCA